MKGCELKKCKDWNGEKCTYPGLFCKYDQADDYPEDAPLAPNGCVIFEGVTKEAHDKLKSDYAALEAKVRRLEGATTDAINDLSDAEGRQSVHEMRNWVLGIMDNLKIARRALKEE